MERRARPLLAEVAEAQRQDSTLPAFLAERADAGYFLGRAFLQQGRAKEAVPIFRVAAQDSEEKRAQTKPALSPDGWSLYIRGGLSEALVASRDLAQARVVLEKNLAAWEEMVAASPIIPWDWRVRQFEIGFLLATVLDPSTPQEARRRETLLERAATFLESHPAGNPLSGHDSELLKKIETLRGAKNATPTETVSVNAAPL